MEPEVSGEIGEQALPASLYVRIRYLIQVFRDLFAGQGGSREEPEELRSMAGVVRLTGKGVVDFRKGSDSVADIPQGTQFHVAHLHKDERFQAGIEDGKGTSHPSGGILPPDSFTDLKTERYALPLIGQHPGIILHGTGQDDAAAAINFKYFSCFSDDIGADRVSDQVAVTGAFSSQSR